MRTCEKHDDTLVVYEDRLRNCPFCDKVAEFGNLEEEKEAATNRIGDLETDLEDAREKIKALEA